MDSHSREQLIVLYDDFLLRTRGSDDVSTSKRCPRPLIFAMSLFCEIIFIVFAVLNVWSQKLAFAACEKSSSLDAFLRDFYLDSSKLYEPSVSAVALVGWSLAKIGLIWDRIESQVNFTFHVFQYVAQSRSTSISMWSCKIMHEYVHTFVPNFPQSTIWTLVDQARVI